MSDTRQHVHAMIDLLLPAQLAAVEGLLETIVDPVAAALHNAPPDDEPVTDEDRRRLREGKGRFAEGQGVPMDDVLAGFGLTAEDIQK